MEDHDEPTVSDDCVHRWVLEVATGAGTPAKCRLCGAERRFTDAKRDWRRRSS